MLGTFTLGLPLLPLDQLGALRLSKRRHGPLRFAPSFALAAAEPRFLARVYGMFFFDHKCFRNMPRPLLPWSPELHPLWLRVRCAALSGLMPAPSQGKRAGHGMKYTQYEIVLAKWFPVWESEGE